MPLDMKSKTDRTLVLDAFKSSDEDLIKPRAKRIEFIKEFAGHHYFEEKSSEETILPTLYEMVETYVQKLAANNPQVTTDTDYIDNRPFARAMGLLINRRFEEINAHEVFKELLLDAIFWQGVAEIHNGDSHPLDFGEYAIDPGLATICRVPPDDFVWDTSAACLAKTRFVGKHFRADLEALESDPNIDQKALAKATKELTNEPTRDGQEKTSSLSQGTGSTRDMLAPGVDLVQVFLRYERKSVTLVKGQPELPPLLLSDWTGSPNGPYRVLRMSIVPDQIGGLAPVSVVEVLHRLINRLAYKLREQANQQKNVLAFEAAGQQAANAVLNAKNGEGVHAPNLDKIKMFSTMGPDNALQAYLLSMQQAQNEAGGNWKVMAGLAPQAETYGQEKLLYGAASQKEAKMLNEFLTFIAHCTEDLGWLLWQDKFYERDLFKQEGRLQMKYKWQPGNRVGKYDQYRFGIEPFSTMYVDPSQKFLGLMKYLQERMVLEQSQAYNLAELDEVAAEYLNLPKIRSICATASPLAPDNFQGSNELPKPGKPNGDYDRTSHRAPGSGDYANKQLQQALVSGNSQMAGQGIRDM